jgi:hypothetical protein
MLSRPGCLRLALRSESERSWTLTLAKQGSGAECGLRLKRAQDASDAPGFVRRKGPGHSLSGVVYSQVEAAFDSSNTVRPRPQPLGRKQNKPTPLNVGSIFLLRQRFLDATNRVCPEVVEGLKKVRSKSSFDQWAEKFGDTWLEKTAKSTLAVWQKNPAFKKESGWREPVVWGDYPYGYPNFSRMRQRMDGFHVTSYLFSPVTQKLLLHAALDDDLKDIDTWAASEELTVQKLIPKDLDKKLECAALYLFRGWTLDQVRSQDGYRTSGSNMHSWIHQTLKLLDLPMRRHGHRAH